MESGRAIISYPPYNLPRRSNFIIEARTVLFEPRGAWRILAESGFCGGNSEQTALRADHIFGGNLNSEFWRRG
ncbi:MAG TPA: hypothetical protein DIU16_02705 [Candidatus Vogelbacteria bacterium]|uniref:Uncharacterized protein n=1 Tax=Candidatus Vogelbacteria bacterium RIFOXYD1_FULL_51_18 TaxID=1802440 RepID=A0A1G2QJD7_9BACT|nr:MAG: hypothetical protein A2569_03275 [Candidatus Vogelbacteria bacterium RIFOXYD1_FULL_51_18]HCQ92253.1 hypothetical protein [Candidatus Vogelbacteria bacterium]